MCVRALVFVHVCVVSVRVWLGVYTEKSTEAIQIKSNAQMPDLIQSSRNSMQRISQLRFQFVAVSDPDTCGFDTYLMTDVGNRTLITSE